MTDHPGSDLRGTGLNPVGFTNYLIMGKTKTPEELERKAKAREEYLAEGLKRAKSRRRKRNQRPKAHRRRFTCDMGYADCEMRGYCNGDC